jgi:hypothetical protein
MAACSSVAIKFNVPVAPTIVIPPFEVDRVNTGVSELASLPYSQLS